MPYTSITPSDPLRAFQQENIDWLSRVHRGLLADEPGLGKSRSAIEAMAAVGAKRVLIVAPRLILQTGVWEDEVQLWGRDDTEYFTATYHELNVRRKTAKGGTRPVKVLADGIKPNSKNRWDGIIVDEAHYIKGRDSLWTWAVKQLSRSTDNLIMLTGTPIPNWAHEVFTLLQCIYPDRGKIGNDLGSFWRWAAEWFDVDANYAAGNPHAKTLQGLKACTRACLLRDSDDPCEHYLDFAAGNFGDHYMRHLRSDHLDLPPIHFEDIEVPMDPWTRKSYQSLKKDFAASVDGKEVLAWSLGARNVMLDRMTTSPWFLNKEGEPRGGKLERLRADLASRSEPTLVFAHYRDSVEAAAEVGRSVGRRTGFIHGGTTESDNSRTIRDFKAGKLDALVGSLETLSEGVTLTIANSAIFLERSYKPSRNTQATYRIYRLGQDRPCTITRYLTTNSIDMGKEKLLQAKNDHQMRTLTAADWLRVA